jgi:hypothetical protein
MDVRRQGQASEGGYAEAPAQPRREVSVRDNNSGLLNKILVVALIVVSVVVLGWFSNKAYAAVRADSAVKAAQYQAVFLTNGQVYFGKYSAIDNTYVKLTDIYYLQVQQTVQPGSSSSSSSSNANQQVSLAKLGGELHGPEDQMYINRDQVLFWENLKNSGKVVQAIQKYQTSGGK